MGNGWKHGPAKGSGGPGHGPAKGPGWGGPARGGDAQPMSADNQPSPEAKAIGHEVAREVKARIAARRHELVDRKLAIGMGEVLIQGQEPPAAVQLAALDKLLNRIAPTADAETMAEGFVRNVVRVPVEPETVEEWQAIYAPKT